jgi:cupin 2 domain-containing protein
MTKSGVLNLLDVSGVSMNMPDELVQTIAAGKNVRVERIVSVGHASPKDFWYNQRQAEWVMLLAGAAELEFADGNISALVPGDSLLIPAHQRHRVKSTAAGKPTIWLAVFFDE